MPVFREVRRYRVKFLDIQGIYQYITDEEGFPKIFDKKEQAEALVSALKASATSPYMANCIRWEHI